MGEIYRVVFLHHTLLLLLLCAFMVGIFGYSLVMLMIFGHRYLIILYLPCTVTYSYFRKVDAYVSQEESVGVGGLGVKTAAFGHD